MDKPEPVALSLNDLQQVLNIFDVCTQRSAFKASELEAVGRLYNHLSRFVKENTPAEKTDEVEATSTDVDSSEPVNSGSEEPKNL